MGVMDSELSERAAARIGTTLRDKYRIESVLGIVTDGFAFYVSRHDKSDIERFDASNNMMVVVPAARLARRPSQASLSRRSGARRRA